jgi:DNA-binding PadR family transcriptional regulator
MATSDTTRLLVLGVTQIFEPANGYQLRRELLSWEVDDWAHVNPGSIYSMLSTLTKQGMLERIDLVTSPGARPVAVYRMTPAGREELIAVVKTGIAEVRQFETTEFYAAMSLVTGLLPREQVIPLLEQRLVNLRAAIARLEGRIAALSDDISTPPHVARLLGYSVAGAAAELDWVAGFAASVRAGEMVFLGEPAMEKWMPARDDPAWRMVRERAVYLEKLAELDAR